MKAIAKYRKTNVTTASRMQLLVMLYDGFQRLAQAAVGALEAGDPAVSGENIGRAMAIVHELEASLNHAAAPEIADNLRTLYEYVENRLLQSNLNQDPAFLRDAIGVMGELRDAWVQLPAHVEAA